MATLTIAIPTYNRNETFKKNFLKLRKQLTESTSVLILDNCSPIPIQVDVSDNVRIIRNPVNIGGNANIIRCFELCDTEWIWVLGDDDEIVDGAIATIFENIRIHHAADLINFSTRNAFTRNASVVGTGRPELLSKLDDFGNLLFISSSIFNAKKIRTAIEYGYHFGYSCAPHIAMLLMSFSRESSFILSSDAIVSWERQINENRGSLLVVARGIPLLFDLPLDKNEKKSLGLHLSKFPSMSAIAHQIFLQIFYGKVSRSIGAGEYGSIAARYPWHLCPKKRVIAIIWKVLLIFPKTSYRLIVKPLYKRMTGHDSGENKIGLDRL